MIRPGRVQQSVIASVADNSRVAAAHQRVVVVGRGGGGDRGLQGRGRGRPTGRVEGSRLVGNVRFVNIDVVLSHVQVQSVHVVQLSSTSSWRKGWRWRTQPAINSVQIAVGRQTNRRPMDFATGVKETRFRQPEKIQSSIINVLDNYIVN